MTKLFKNFRKLFSEDSSLTSDVPPSVTVNGQLNANATTSNQKESFKLDYKIAKFIKWYGDTYNIYLAIDLKNFIEKMAVWYELRYPDYEINRILHCTGQESKKISQIMFNQNPYINTLFDKNAEIRALDWDEFYNTDSFIKSLPSEERSFLDPPRYPSFVVVNSTSIYLTKDGFIKYIEKDDHSQSFTEKNIHLKEYVKNLKSKGILPENNELEVVINNYENNIYSREELLNSVMYKIIKRGGTRLGCRRAFLFAKEFDRDINIPMRYGIDFTDPGLRLFINEYLKAGGSKELICIVGDPNNHGDLKTMSIKEILQIKTCYTSEERDLHQRFVDILSNKANKDAKPKGESEAKSNKPIYSKHIYSKNRIHNEGA